MRKLLVQLSGFYLLVFGAFQLARFWVRYNYIFANADVVHRGFLAINFTIFSFFGILSIVMGFGIISYKNWARNLLLVLSGLGFFSGVSILVFIAFLRFFMPIGTGPTSVTSILNVYYWLHVLTCLVIAPAFFLYLFTRRSIIKLFARK
ncbi:MAG: hypothetical protein WC491_03810 [Candidatus Omnitrophota bacterium]